MNIGHTGLSVGRLQPHILWSTNSPWNYSEYRSYRSFSWWATGGVNMALKQKIRVAAYLEFFPLAFCFYFPVISEKDEIVEFE